MSAYDEMYSKIQAMSDRDLFIVWDALDGYDPSEEYSEGIPMDRWAEAIYNEITLHRQLPLNMCFEHPNDSAAGVTMDELIYLFDLL